VLVTDYQWNYVSTWADIKAALTDVKIDNFVVGKVILKNTQNSLVANFSESQVVAVSEIDDIVVVNTDDAVLVIAQSQAGKVKEIVSELEKQGMSDFI